MTRRFGDRYTPAAELLWHAQRAADRRWLVHHLKAAQRRIDIERTPMDVPELRWAIPFHYRLGAH